ncbi:MAG TPA: aldehyde dehydrogenase family protein [Rhodocyclaceae bacterium]
MTASTLAHETARLLAELGVATPLDTGSLACYSPIDGSLLARLSPTPTLEPVIARAQAAFEAWRSVPPPRRGELVRHYGDILRRHKEALARLVSIENGKILSEGRGEVQEMIDICDFAVGLSRQLYGLTIASERPGHRMMETWHPLGICGVISAFNFPVAVWAWNAALALVCGDSVIWKPSSQTPLCALACQALLDRAALDCGAPPDLNQVLICDGEAAAALVDHPAVALISATGSSAMGRSVAPRVAARFGRNILELGGNNGMIVAPSADLELALRAIVFAAAGTAGQRCTSLRRLFVQQGIYAELLPRLRLAFASLSVGNPLETGVLVGPLINDEALAAHQAALDAARAYGGLVHGGERVAVPGCDQGCYVRPALVEMPEQAPVMHHETFSPILYAMAYDQLDEAIALHNAVPQGLASSIFSNDVREVERFLAASDCGIANVNIGPSGAEIGGAFGGEKETGGGREAGSDAWKAYMRRATNTINYSSELPLAQGVQFL